MNPEPRPSVGCGSPPPNEPNWALLSGRNTDWMATTAGVTCLASGASVAVMRGTPTSVVTGSAMAPASEVVRTGVDVCCLHATASTRMETASLRRISHNITARLGLLADLAPGRLSSANSEYHGHWIRQSRSLRPRRAVARANANGDHARARRGGLAGGAGDTRPERLRRHRVPRAGTAPPRFALGARGFSLPRALHRALSQRVQSRSHSVSVDRSRLSRCRDVAV